MVFVAVSRYVSMSALGGGFVFFLVHFARVKDPWSPEERGMSILTVALLILLIVRHRKNLSRVAAGTEPKVSFRRRPKNAPAGFISARGVLLLALMVAAVLGGGMAVRRGASKETLKLGGRTLTEVSRAATGHQRADRVAFAQDGNMLAVTCPRYDRLVLYRVTPENTLETAHDFDLGGQPVAVCARGERFYVLMRPSGDRRHVERGWWQAYDAHGEKVGPRGVVGYYPDDLALTRDGKHAVVLTSGRAEGSPDRLAPALTVYALDDAKELGRIEFTKLTDDPTRLSLSTTGQSAVVTLAHSQETAAVDLADPTQPRLIGRRTLDAVDRPYRSRGEGDAILMPSSDGREALLLNIGDAGTCVASLPPRGSGVEFLPADRRGKISLLPLHSGAFGLGSTRPTGLAFCPTRNLLAIANRSGGVHLVAVQESSTRR